MAATRASLQRVLFKAEHRFRHLRRFTAGFSLVVLAAVPLSGLARLDLAGGRHVALGSRVAWPAAVVAVSACIAAFYIFTFLVNAVGGRLFCGYGCPLAYATRLREAQAAGGGRGAALARAAYALGFGVAQGLWFIDLGAVPFLPPARAAAAIAGAAGIAGALYLHGRLWGWAFCRSWCPIGLYYTVVSPTKGFEIAFDAAAKTCISCNACDAVCPVALPPRALEAAVLREGGLAPEGAPGYNHCLSCGDCVEACEHATRKAREKRAEKAGGPVAPAPLQFRWWFERKAEDGPVGAPRAREG